MSLPRAVRHLRGSAPTRDRARREKCARLLSTGSYLPIILDMPRRKPGHLLPLEVEILQTAMTQIGADDPTFHGFALAQTMGESGSGRLIAHGTLYKAMARLEEMGLLSSHWEDEPPEGRPRRRLYELTAAGARAATSATYEPSRGTVQRGLAPGTA